MYTPEIYWDNVAAAIEQRSHDNIIAGDDEPYYVYKRKRLLTLFKEIDVNKKHLLEFGCGPGGNLLYFSAAGATVSGVDISAKMLRIAAKRLAGKKVELQKINSHLLPYPSDKFDMVFTVTVLQHNTNEESLQKIIKEIARVCKKDLYLFERIEHTLKGHESNTGRPIAYYQQLLLAEGFKLTSTKFIPLQASYTVCGIIRKLFSDKHSQEGKPMHKMAVFLQKLFLPFTSLLDLIIPSNRDVARLHFQRKM